MKKSNKSERFAMRTTADFFELIDEWRKQQDAIPSRADAVRELTVRALFQFWGKIINESIHDGFETVSEYESSKANQELDKIWEFCKENKIDMELEFADLSAGHGADVRVRSLKEK